MAEEREWTRGVLMLGGALAVCIFMLDIVMPLGMAVVGYVLVVVLAVWIPGHAYPIGAAAACSLLLLIGYAFAPTPGGAERLVVGAVIWFAAGLIGAAQHRKPLGGWPTEGQGKDSDQPACGDCDRLRAALKIKRAELERFTYAVSHDLRTPLVTIQGFADFLQADVQAGDQERIREDVACLTEGVQTLERQLDALLELSRISRKVSAPSAISLSDLVADALKHVALIEERDITVHVAPDLPTVYADRCFMLEVMQSLVINAIENSSGVCTPTLEVGVQQKESSDGMAVCFIRDNGTPIDPHNQGKVFDPFAHLEQDGSGKQMGLAYARRIVEVHGGQMWMDAGQMENGNILYFSLPVKEHSIEQLAVDATRHVVS